ncbi:unnamed protein product, partial [Iphiclides podalirius]
MKRSVAPHLADEKLYSAYGGILRIAAAVQSYGKGLARRNLLEDEEQVFSRWHPWRTLADTYIYVDPDWTPMMYIMMVSFAAFVICLSQICYSLVFGKVRGCRCVSDDDHMYPDPGCEQRSYATMKRPYATMKRPYATMKSTYPAALPAHHSSILYSDRARTKRTRIGAKTCSLRSMQTQRVYDLHENTEKLMAVIMSDNQETSDAESDRSKRLEGQVTGRNAAAASARDASPPEIETSISELKIDKSPNVRRSQMYSTSTNSHSAITYCNEHRDTGSAWSATTTSEQSITSGSFKSRCRKTKNSRDLAWARRIASKASQAKSATSGTEMDVNSFITPPSKHLSR